MARPRISVITPIHCWNDYRKDGIKRAGESLAKQTFKDFEWVVVNDGSTVEFTVPWWAKVIDKVHEERVVALNEGFKNAEGEIFCLLDSDDEYAPNYLERVDSLFRQYPTYKLFNFGATYIHKDGGTASRGPFTPKKRKVGHVDFGGGNIVNGTFVWHRSVYDELGAYPPAEVKKANCKPINYPLNYHHGPDEKPEWIRDLTMASPYDFSAAAQLEFPKIRKYFMVDVENEPGKVIRELGNPWGQDFYLFYKYTRKYHSKPIDEPLYIVHPKTQVE